MSVVEPASAVGGVHDWFSWVVVLSNALVGLWALGAHRRPRLRGRALWVSTAAAQSTVFVQAGLGTWLMAAEHALYGFSTLVAVGIAYSYRQQLRDRVCLLYGCAGLFLMGLGIRAMILDSFG